MTVAGRLLPCLLALLLMPGAASARTVYRCLQNGTVSLATAPRARLALCRHPGRRQCRQTAQPLGHERHPEWRALRTSTGRQDRLQHAQPARLHARTGLHRHAAAGRHGPCRPGRGREARPAVHAELFRAAARANRIEDAWLRAIAHAESGFQADAVSSKGAQGIMQLLPATAREYRVKDPFAPAEAIPAGARYLADLLRRYKGDRRLATAAYNAGIGTVARYGGVPPYAETQAYVEKVEILYARYLAALARSAKPAKSHAR